MKKVFTKKEVYWLESREFPVDLSLSENPLGCSSLIKKRIDFRTLNISEYPKPKKAIEAISSRFSIPRKNLSIGAGADEFINLIPQLFLRKNDFVLMPRITFPRFEMATRLFGGQPVFAPMKKNMRVDFEAIKRHLHPRIKLIFLANPNNPTGLIEDRGEIIVLVRQTKAMVVIDEAGIDFTGEKFSLIKEATKLDNLIVLRSFSKSYGMAGLRIGFCVALPKIINALHSIKLPFSVPSIAIEAAVVALSDSQHIEKMKDFMRREVKFLSKGLTELGFTVLPTDSNHFLVKMNSLFLSSTDFVQSINRKGAQVVDGRCFRGLGSKFIRLSPRDHKTNSKFLKIVKELIKERLNNK